MEYSPHQFFFYRSPAYSNEETDISASLEFFFKKKLKSKTFIDTLLISSESLHREALSWKNEDSLEETRKEKLLLSLLKYWIRGTTRPTPFGGFAGMGIGELGSESKIILNDSRDYYHVLDMRIVGEFEKVFHRNPRVKLNSIFYPNNTLYQFGKIYRYIETETVTGGKRQHKLSQVDASTYLSRVIEYTQCGKGFGDIVSFLVDDEVDHVESTSFVMELIANQVLICSTSPSVIGERPDKKLLKQLKKALGSSSFAIQRYEKILSSIERNTLIDADTYQSLRNNIQSIAPSTRSLPMVNTEMFLKDSAASLDKGWTENITRSITFLMGLDRGKDQSSIANFMSRFTERYEGREIPLMEAIDPEQGVGFDIFTNVSSYTLLKEVPLESKKPTYKNIPTSSFKDFIKEKLIDCLWKGQTNIELKEKELEKFTKNEPHSTSQSSVIFGSILPPQSTPTNQENEFLLKFAGGPTPTQFLGRFCHGNTKIASVIQDITKLEDELANDFIVAEVVHNPDQISANVMARPTLRKFEISCHTHGSSDATQIPLNDLFVSVESNRVFLRSKKHNKYILPLHSNAHNPMVSNLPLYRFLLSLQKHHSESSFSWDWGTFFSAKYLPRITFKNIILQRARWTVTEDDVKSITSKDESELTEQLKRFQIKRKMPNVIYMAEGDNELRLNLANIHCIKLFLQEVKKKKSLILLEGLEDRKNDFIINAKNQTFSNEVVIPIIGNQYKLSPSTKPKTSIQRIFLPGDQWVYLKLYSGIETASSFLSETLPSLLDELFKSRCIKSWFFLRYQDPENHLRIRFLLTSKTYYNKTCEVINNYVTDMEDTSLFRMTYDTYEREVERYHPEFMKLSETLFFHDSLLVIKILELISGTNDENKKWLYSLKVIHQFLNDLEIDNETRSSLFTQLEKSFSEEIENWKLKRKEINALYRKYKKQISIHLFEKENHDRIDEVIDLRSNGIKKIKKDLVHAISELKKNDAHKSWLSSHIHMFINRFFKNDQRKHELIIYAFLSKTYMTEIKKRS